MMRARVTAGQLALSTNPADRLRHRRTLFSGGNRWNLTFGNFQLRLQALDSGTAMLRCSNHVMASPAVLHS